MINFFMGFLAGATITAVAILAYSVLEYCRFNPGHKVGMRDD